MTRYSEALRGNDIGDFCDLIWANASRRAVAATPSSQSSLSRPSGLPSLSQKPRDGGGNATGDNPPPMNT